MDGANPLLVSTSESDDDSEDDGTAVQLGAVAVAAAAEAAAVVAAGADQWVPVAATSDGCSLLLIPPCDLAQLQRCGYCNTTDAPDPCPPEGSAVITYWRPEEALLHLQPWRRPEPQPEPEPELQSEPELEWSRALWTQPAHTRSQKGGAGRGVASALEPGASRGAGVVSAAGQSACHEAVLHQHNIQLCQGYASHVQVDRSCFLTPPSRPLLLLERPAQTGSSVWGCARVFRRWALANPQLLVPRGDAGPDGGTGGRCQLLELGAGVGLVGVSLAVDLGADVIMTDFDGHFFSALFEDDPEDSVLALLAHNAAANAALAEASGGRMSVSALDWAEPSAPRAVWLPPAAEAAAGAGVVTPADVIVGTELIYTIGSAALLCDTLRAWLKPSGVFYLLQAQNRVDMSRFEGLAAEAGFDVKEVELGEAVSASDEVAGATPGHFRMIALTWLGTAADDDASTGVESNEI